MSKQSYCKGKLSMSSVKQVVIWVALGAWICPFHKTPSKREHWRYTFTKSFKQASKHLWGQGAPTDLAFPTDMLAKYAAYLTPSVGSQLVQGRCEAHILMHPLNLHRTFSWLCLMTVHSQTVKTKKIKKIKKNPNFTFSNLSMLSIYSYRNLEQFWVSTKIYVNVYATVWVHTLIITVALYPHSLSYKFRKNPEEILENIRG